MPKHRGETGAGADDFPRLTEGQLHDVAGSLDVPRSFSPHVVRGVISALEMRAAALRGDPDAGTIDQRDAFDVLSRGLCLTEPAAPEVSSEFVTGVVGGAATLGMGDSPAALAAAHLGLTLWDPAFPGHGLVRGDR